MGCGADYSQAGRYSSAYHDYSSSSSEDRAAGMQYASNRAGMVAFCRSADATKDAVEGDILGAQQAGYK